MTAATQTTVIPGEVEESLSDSYAPNDDYGQST
jgi:hypothetical protein